MLWRNTKECVVSENSCSKNFVNFQEKHPGEIAFLNKVEGYLTLTGNVLLENLWNGTEQVSKETCRLLQLVVAGKCFNQNIFFKKYLIRFDIQWHVLPEIKCITEVWRPFRCLSWFVLGLFGSLLFRLYSSGQAARSQALSRLHIQLFFLNKFQGGGLHMVAQERINVHETVGRKNN